MKITEDITEIKNTLGLSDEDIVEANKFLNENLEKETKDFLLEISKSNLGIGQITFVAYMRGMVEYFIPYVPHKKYKNQRDAFAHISRGFEGWNEEKMLNTIVPIFQTLFVEIIQDPEKISEFSIFLSDYFKTFSEEIKKEQFIKELGIDKIGLLKQNFKNKN